MTGDAGFKTGQDGERFSARFVKGVASASDLRAKSP
jgi:hypothetical protein